MNDKEATQPFHLVETQKRFRGAVVHLVEIRHQHKLRRISTIGDVK